ncbi:MAG TPA: lipopolysaccharide kinase InaA family protein [Longimicrobiales bacterium]
MIPSRFELPEPYGATRVGEAILIARAEAIEPASRALRQAGSLFAFAAACADAEPLEGRGAVYSIPAPGGRWVVRHYRRGGAVARILEDRYLRAGAPRPVRELRTSHAVRVRGIDSPEVVAGVIYPAGPAYRADLATRYIPHSADLARVLFGPERPAAERESACAAAGGLLRAMHERGVIHPDLNLKNILLEWTTDPPRAHLLDLDRGRVVERVPRRRREAMLRRFWRSARKWETRTGRRLSRAERDAFHAAYAAGDA